MEKPKQTLEMEIERLTTVPEDEDSDDRADRLENLKEKREELAELRKSQIEAEKTWTASKTDLEKARLATFATEVKLFRQVQADISSTYEKILLKHGGENVRQHLQHLYGHFEHSVVNFRKQTDGVNKLYSSQVLSKEECLAICRGYTPAKLNLRLTEG